MSIGNPQFNSQSPSPNLSESLKQKQEVQWEEKRKEIEQITDGTGRGIDEGIKETVAAFCLNEIPTSQSCEGHIDSHTEDYHPAMAPWVEVYPKEPEQKGWQYDDELRKKVEMEGDTYLSMITNLLNEFYANQQVPADVKLGIDPIAYGFRVQSNGLESLTDPSDNNQKQKAKRYKEEMGKFTYFLKDKFLNKK